MWGPSWGGQVKHSRGHWRARHQRVSSMCCPRFLIHERRFRLDVLEWYVLCSRVLSLRPRKCIPSFLLCWVSRAISPTRAISYNAYEYIPRCPCCAHASAGLWLPFVGLVDKSVETITLPIAFLFTSWIPQYPRLREGRQEGHRRCARKSRILRRGVPAVPGTVQVYDGVSRGCELPKAFRIYARV